MSPKDRCLFLSVTPIPPRGHFRSVANGITSCFARPFGSWIANVDRFWAFRPGSNFGGIGRVHHRYGPRRVHDHLFVCHFICEVGAEVGLAIPKMVRRRIEQRRGNQFAFFSAAPAPWTQGMDQRHRLRQSRGLLADGQAHSSRGASTFRITGGVIVTPYVAHISAVPDLKLLLEIRSPPPSYGSREAPGLR